MGGQFTPKLGGQFNRFFQISGYLIFQSVIRSKSLVNYFWNRILRIFPALITALVLSVCFCYFAYQGINSYWSNSSTQSYIPNNILLFKGQGFIDGVFINNRYRPAINGSLWTIRYEFVGYILLSLFFFIKEKRKLLKYIFLFLYCLFLIMAIFYPNRGGNFNFIANIFNLGNNLFINLFCFFIGGSLLAIFEIEKTDNKTKFLLLVSLSLLFLVSLQFNMFWFSQFIFLPILTVLFGASSYPIINQWSKQIGDLSYGIYIYSFPVQQILEYFFKPNLIEMMCVSFLITIIIAHFSWQYIEKNALKLKKLF